MAKGLYRDGFGPVEVDYGGARDAGYWRSRAEQTRVIAKEMDDPVAIATMLKVAEQCEEMAQLSERLCLAK
jgi:hypothetical protein